MSGKLRVYKEKLEGYKKFYQIVKTIKMVTLAKYRQTVSRVKSRDMSVRYTDKAFFEASNEEEVIKKAEKTLLYVPFTSNRGSCGALNSNVNRYIESVIGSKTKLLPIGKKGNDSLSKLFPEVYTYSMINDMKNAQSFAWSSFVWENCLAVPDVERYQFVYHRYVSAATQRTAVINIPNFEAWYKKLNDDASTDSNKERYCFANAVTNQDEQFVRDFYDFHASQSILHAACENELSEYAARIIAVEGQLTNIEQLQHHTNYLFNKTRQSSITASLIEIISAMNSLEGNAAKGVKREEFW